MKLTFTAIFLSIAWSVFAQTYSLTGDIFGEDGSPTIYGSVVLLNPSDSTMQSFGVTNKSGHFDIKNIKKGEYILQVAFMGFETYYNNVSIPVESNNLGQIIMKPKSINVKEVTVSGEYVPLAIKNDTIEYNAAAFNLKPDAVTEDLLKKLPGVEVDRAGNIKAMGEDVKKLYVDGKEFFGNDPKVATKNVPADAVDKVQVYNRKSDEAMFTGIDDGSRDKAINLKLKEDKKNALFGDVMAGGGSDSRWQNSAKAYRFTDKIQVAALGMGNNINQFGFSFNDYMNFNGGVGQMIHGGGGSARISINNDGSFPINFGEPVAGLNTSGAGGANFSYSTSPNDRVFMSYLGSATKKELEQTSTSKNFVEGDSYLQQQELNETDKNQAHNFNFGWRNRIDSTQNLIINGNFTLNYGDNNRLSLDKNAYNNILVNQMENRTANNSNRMNGTASGSYTKLFNKGKTVLDVSGNIIFSQGLTKDKIYTETIIHNNDEIFISDQYQNNQTDNLRYSVNSSLSQKVGAGLYLVPELIVGNSTENLDRTQGFPDENYSEIDSLSPEFQKRQNRINPKLSLKRSSKKTNFTISLQNETGRIENTMNRQDLSSTKYSYFLPSFWYEYEFQTGRRLMIFYNSSVNTPEVIQLLPVINNINPLAQYYGNPNLKPEVAHEFNTHYILFDQFSFTSVMATLSGTYTRDKINWVRTVNNNLAMINTLDNFDNDYKMRGNIDFSTPLRRLGMKVHLNFEENWNQGLNMINDIENEYTSLSHKASFSIDNRKKEKWDVNTGVQATLSNSKYSVQESMNNNYFDISLFGETRFTPSESWNFEVTADITNYSDKSFGESQLIPLLGAEISHYFLKNKRGTITLKGFDLLNKNQIIKRFGELNYLREIRSNSIGRFVMLSFTYRLNKFGNNKEGIEVKMRR